jgi:hypothetical protein
MWDKRILRIVPIMGLAEPEELHRILHLAANILKGEDRNVWGV